jgi:hypothetical protein
MPTVANTILQQLGGAQFVALTGASKFVAGDQFLQFSLPRGCNARINKCRITLDPCDTYTVEFWSTHGTTLELVSSNSDVYCDVLQDLFERVTGLYVTLFPRRA